MAFIRLDAQILQGHARELPHAGRASNGGTEVRGAGQGQTNEARQLLEEIVSPDVGAAGTGPSGRTQNLAELIILEPGSENIRRAVTESIDDQQFLARVAIRCVET